MTSTTDPFEVLRNINLEDTKWSPERQLAHDLLLFRIYKDMIQAWGDMPKEMFDDVREG